MVAPGSSVLKVARWVCSRRALESVVVPALADLQHEHPAAAAEGPWARRRLLLQSYAGLLAALALHLATCPARHVRENWAASDAPGWRLLRPAAGLVAVILVAMVALLLSGGGPTGSAGGRTIVLPAWVPLLFVPCTACVVAPHALLLALVIALRKVTRGQGVRGWCAPAAGVSLLAAAGVLLLWAWLAPTANQSFREVVVRALAGPGISNEWVRSPYELTLFELSTILRMQGTTDPNLATRWHSMLAIPLACAALGPLAVALVGARRGLFRTLCTVAGVLAVFTVVHWVGWQRGVDGRLPAVLGAWAPAGWIVLLAVVGLARTRDEAPAGL